MFWHPRAVAAAPHAAPAAPDAVADAFAEVVAVAAAAAAAAAVLVFSSECPVLKKIQAHQLQTCRIPVLVEEVLGGRAYRDQG